MTGIGGGRDVHILDGSYDGDLSGAHDVHEGDGRDVHVVNFRVVGVIFGGHDVCLVDGRAVGALCVGRDVHVVDGSDVGERGVLYYAVERKLFLVKSLKLAIAVIIVCCGVIGGAWMTWGGSRTLVRPCL